MEEGEDGHHEFDASQLREHEEFTKVKNVERIELGRFEMETWYFSPLPPEYKDCKVRCFFLDFAHLSPKDRHGAAPRLTMLAAVCCWHNALASLPAATSSS